ncbi:PQQ-dependent sugar dehydrogenase [Pendulispora rubella]|uniref:PQQ-dependent sugar dehydrogenase n=1 Tax=Pendulispora rubella TaxID=2741070 RepID=A0ABZ2L4C6_9BACT
MTHRTLTAASAGFLVLSTTWVGCTAANQSDEDPSLARGEVANLATDYEAENGVCQGTIDSNHSGYSGTGFCNTDNAVGAAVEWTVNAAAAGNVAISVRYANGTTVDRPADISVNGTVVAAAKSFAGTGAWTTWTNVTLNVGLVAGSNKVRLAATTANGAANIDRLSVDAPSDTQAPTIPQNLRTTDVQSKSITLAWDPSTDNVGVTAYDIGNDGQKFGEVTGNPPPATKTLTGLRPKTTYRLTVFGRDAAGNVSQASNQVNVTTPPTSDTTPPTAPGNLSSSDVTNTSVKLSWTASTDNVGVTGYDIYANNAPLIQDLPPSTSYTVTNLAANTEYSFSVRAKDDGNNVSNASNTVTVRTANVPPGGGVPTSVSTVSSGWSIPWGAAWLPDGSALLNERETFNMYKLTQSGTKTLVGKVPNVVTTNGEGGLLGLAVDPNWNSNHYVYVMHTASEGNRIARLTYDGNSLSGYTSLVQGIAKNNFHNGGRIAFGPDGFLYATCGDARNGSLAQDKNSLNGKILRIKTDGSAAPGNPFNNRVYSYGHRNPQGLAWDSAGRLWSSELGDGSTDELNLITPGANYGWPTCEGNCNVSGMTNPKKTWSTSQASPSGIDIVNNVVYMASLRGQRLWRIPLDGTNAGTPTAYYVNTYGRLRTVLKVPGQSAFWLTTTNADFNGSGGAGSDKVYKVLVQ